MPLFLVSEEFIVLTTDRTRPIMKVFESSSLCVIIIGVIFSNEVGKEIIRNNCVNSKIAWE